MPVGHQVLCVSIFLIEAVLWSLDTRHSKIRSTETVIRQILYFKLALTFPECALRPLTLSKYEVKMIPEIPLANLLTSKISLHAAL